MITFTFKQFIENIANPTAPGPSTTFKVSHVFYALELMSESPIGRNKLAKQLGIGEGAIRTLINRLKQIGLICTSKEGCSLTTKGQDVWKVFKEYFPTRVEMRESDLIRADHSYAFLIKASGHKVRSGIEQRDAAIVAGAQRAVVVVCENGLLAIDSVSANVAARFPHSASQIMNSMNPQNQDVVIIVGAKTLLNAKHGAFAASWTLVNGSNGG